MDLISNYSNWQLNSTWRLPLLKLASYLYKSAQPPRVPNTSLLSEHSSLLQTGPIPSCLLNTSGFDLPPSISFSFPISRIKALFIWAVPGRYAHHTRNSNPLGIYSFESIFFITSCPLCVFSSPFLHFVSLLPASFFFFFGTIPVFSHLFKFTLTHTSRTPPLLPLSCIVLCQEQRSTSCVVNIQACHQQTWLFPEHHNLHLLVFFFALFLLLSLRHAIRFIWRDGLMDSTC